MPSTSPHSNPDSASIRSSASFRTPDPNNGQYLDRTRDIVQAYGKDNAAYFAAKEYSIKKAFRNDYDSAVRTGVSTAELQEWLREHHKLLEQLEFQRDDAHDLALLNETNTGSATSGR